MNIWEWRKERVWFFPPKVKGKKNFFEKKKTVFPEKQKSGMLLQS